MDLVVSKCVWWRSGKPSDIILAQSADSEIFCFDEKYFYLFLELNTVSDSSQDYITVSLHLGPDSDKNDLHTVCVRVFIEDHFSKVNFLQKSIVEKSVMHEKEKQVIWTIKRSDFTNYLNLSQLQYVDFIVMFGEVFQWVNYFGKEYRIHTENRTEHRMIQTSFEHKTSCMESLSEDFRKLFMSKTDTDLTLKCGDEIFSVHKSILSARSAVFAEMIQIKEPARSEDPLHITDTDPGVLSELLIYMYSGILTDIEGSTIPRLYVAAQKYAVKALEKLCRDFLEKDLTESNVCELLILSDAHKDQHLKSRIFSFIRDNGKVLSSEQWSKICDDYPKLAVELYRHLYKNVAPV